MANIRRSRAGGFIRGGRSRRESLWLAVAPSETILTAPGGTISNTLNAAGLALRPFTIVRTRLYADVSSDQVAATEHQFTAVGFCVVSDQATAIGVTAVPTPVTDLGSDLWFMHQWLSSEITVVSAVGLAQISEQFQFDSRAMRKVEEGQDVVLVKEVSALGGGASVFTAGRMLVKLH